MEQLQDEISAVLWTFEKPELIKVCQHLKCSEPTGQGFGGQSRRALIRLAESTLDEIEESEESHLFRQYIHDLQVFIQSLQEQAVDKAETQQTEPSEIERLKQEYTQLQQAQADARRVLEEKIEALGVQLSSTTVAREREVNQPAPITAPEVTLRKDFRIWGQIGEAGQKDKLSFTSLTNQIESGLKKGYLEGEIIEAVIKAVSPGLHLRDLLEVKRDLTLPILRTILRGHYKVDSSSDLLHRLMNISQDPKESAQDFLFRTIELREKLLWKSGDGDEGEQFSPDLIQRKFLRSLETGLFSEAVKFQLKPYLSNPKVTDEVLIEKVNEAASLELERQTKFRRNITVKPTRVNEIHTELQSNHSQVSMNSETDIHGETQIKGGGAVSTKKKQGQSKGLDTETAKLIEGLKADVLEVKKMFNETLEATKPRPSTDTRPSSATRWARGCQACREAQVVDTCRHCYRCGQEGHVSRGCRQSRFTQGNGRGLLSWDPQQSTLRPGPK